MTTKLESCDRLGLLGKNVRSFNVDVRLTEEESTENKKKMPCLQNINIIKKKTIVSSRHVYTNYIII